MLSRTPPRRAVVVVPALAALAGGLVYWRRRGAGGSSTHLLALAQTLLVAQVGLGLLLLSDDRRATDELHYVYGSLALAASSRPGSTRRPQARGACSGSQAPRCSPPPSPCEHS